MATRVSKSSDPRMAVLRDPATLQQLWTGSKRNFKWGGRQPLRRRRGDVHGDLSAVVIRLDWAGEQPKLPGLCRTSVITVSVLVRCECCWQCYLMSVLLHGASASRIFSVARSNMLTTCVHSCAGTESLPRTAFACKRQACAGVAVPRSASGASIASAASFGSLRAAGRASHWDAVRAHFLHFRPAAAEAARARWYAAVDAALGCAAKLRAEAAAEAPAASDVQQAAAAASPAQQPQQAAPQASPAAAAVASPASKAAAGEGAIAIRAVAAPLTVPPAAEADDRAAMRRALATTSFRRLGVNGATAVPLPKDASLSSMRGLTLQQLSVH